MNDTGIQTESEFVFRRLAEPFRLIGLNTEVDGRFWLLILAAVLIVGLGFVVWMYFKDARAVRWYWAAPLGALRVTVYLLLALMFLMPARQAYERSEKRSRVLVVIDVTASMSQVSDEPPSARPSAKPATRLAKVMDYLSDDKIGFVRGLLDKNPVYLYRIGNRLDEDSQQFEKNDSGEYVPIHRVPGPDGAPQRATGSTWGNADWQAFAAYDFKPCLIRGMSDEGTGKVKATAPWDGASVGTSDWAQSWFDKPDSVPADLSPEDKAILEGNRDKLIARIDVARSIASATNLPDSLLALVNREAGNMVQGVIVFSDGQSNLGSSNALQDLRVRAQRERIPIFTVGVGSELRVTAVRITDVQLPEQTPPDEGIKIIVEVDGDGLVGQKIKVELEIQLPKGEPPIRVPGELTFLPGEPPHGQAEFIIDPEKAPEALKNKDLPKELAEGEWKVRAVTPRVEGERFAEKEHFSEWVTMKVQKKAQRVLIFCSAPNRDVQFLVTQMLRDKADMAIFVQNDGGKDGKINVLEEPERQLTRFPDKLRVDDVPNEDPKEKWYNLARYDVIIAFDADWNSLTTEQIAMVRTWVDLQAGGLLFVAGHIHTMNLGRPDAEDKFRPLNDILPVLPGDPYLSAAKRTATTPWRLDFENLSGDLDFMKLDDSVSVDVGWERFFTGRDERDDKARILRGFYNYFPVREMKPVATPIARFPDPNAIKLPDGKAPPFLAVMQYGQGKTGWVGSSEIWRLRQFRDEYFERFWTKFVRYLASGSRRKQTRRGRILMGPTFPAGGYIRLTSQLLDASLQPVEVKTEPKITFRPVELDKYPPEIEKLTNEDAIVKARGKFHDRYTHEFRMAAKKGAEKWNGYFQRAQLAAAEKFPTGTWRVEVEIPSSTETLKQKFTIRQSNAELDVTRPDYAALYAMASPVAEVLPRITDATVAGALQAKTPTGAEGKRLTFKFGDDDSLNVIPQCMVTETKTLRNRGAVVDYWDKGIEVPAAATSWLTGKADRPLRIGVMLLVCTGLLSIEWLTRKLLKLA